MKVTTMAKDYKKNRGRGRAFLLAQLSEGVWENFAVEGVSFLGKIKGKPLFIPLENLRE